MRSGSFTKKRWMHFVPALVFAALAMQGCHWHDDQFKRYAGDRGEVEPCKGICISESIPKNKDACKTNPDDHIQLLWTEDKCMLGEKYLEVDNEEACGNAEGMWIPGECKVLDSDTCATIGGVWADFQLYDMENGQYIRVNGDKYYCGNYQQIADNTATECSSVDNYIEDIKHGLCNSTSFCRLVKLNENDVAACTSCPSGNVKCGNECVDIMNNSNNCGVCGNDCGDNAYCFKGKCIPKTKCPDEENYLKCHLNPETSQYETADELETDFDCLSIKDDSRYCGWKKCENNENILACTEKQSCKNGVCKNFEVKCEGSNSLTCMTDDDIKCINKVGNSTCGAKSCDEDGMGTVCEGDLVCLNANGDCGCPDGLIQAEDNTCHDPNSNTTCGATVLNPDGQNCEESNRYCYNGNCLCKPPLVDCGGTCIDPKSNNTYCGANAECDSSSYTSCVEEFEQCQDGVCVITKENYAYCDGYYYDVTNEVSRYCGARGRCNSSDPESDNFKGYDCGNVDAICIHSLQDDKNVFDCKCNDTQRKFDKELNRCVDINSDAQSCGENLVNCKLRFGEDASCKNGECQCPNSWLKIENDENGNTVEWYHDSEHPYKCIDTMYDNRYCGATNESKGMNCEENNQICVRGECIDRDEQKCRNANGFLCNNRMCITTIRYNMDGCNDCQSDRCVLHGETMEYDGCKGKVGVHCDCNNRENQYEVLINGSYQCVTLEPDKMNIEKCSACYGAYKCKSGWANPELEKLHSDKSFDLRDTLPDAVGCNISLNTIDNCGSVGNRCEIQDADNMHYANVACKDGQCDYTCQGSYIDCDPDKPGCEVDIMNNPVPNGVCGSCNSTCSDDKICQNGNCCYGETENPKQSIKKSSCCDGLTKYRKCVDWFGFVCTDHEYQCFASDPGGDWEEY